MVARRRAALFSLAIFCAAASPASCADSEATLCGSSPPSERNFRACDDAIALIGVYVCVCTRVRVCVRAALLPALPLISSYNTDTLLLPAVSSRRR